MERLFIGNAVRSVATWQTTLSARRGNNAAVGSQAASTG
jgi:hypothetical protein